MWRQQEAPRQVLRPQEHLPHCRQLLHPQQGQWSPHSRRPRQLSASRPATPHLRLLEQQLHEQLLQQQSKLRNAQEQEEEAPPASPPATCL
jgi:hypothetical protein